jgi:hypothetical protein
MKIVITLLATGVVLTALKLLSFNIPWVIIIIPFLLVIAIYAIAFGVMSMNLMFFIMRLFNR